MTLYVERPVWTHEPVKIWLNDSWLHDQTEPPKPDLMLNSDQMNAMVIQWLQGPPGPPGRRGPSGPPGYPLDMNLVERVEQLAQRVEQLESRVRIILHIDAGHPDELATEEAHFIPIEDESDNK